MARSRAELIDELADDLRPARGPRRVETLVLLWLAISWTVVLAGMLAAGPFRPGWIQQLLETPRLLIESGLGIAAGAIAITQGFRLGLPGSRLRACVGIATAGLLVWAAAYVVAIFLPAVEPTMFGKRDGCTSEVLIFGSLPMLLGLVLLRVLAPLRRVWTGAVVGAASGALPGLVMQMACMYVPEHILIHHVAPIALLAAAGAALGPLVLRRI